MRTQMLHVAVAALAVLLFANVVFAQTIIPSPFVTSYDGWTDMFDGVFPSDTTERNFQPYQPQWGVLLGHDLLVENSNGSISSLKDGSSFISGTYEAFNLVTSAGATPPTNYTLDVTFSSFDNDGLGIIFGYQDEDYYYRVGARAQTHTGGNFNQGIGVQKIVGGVVVEEIVAPTGTYIYPTDGTEFTLGVSVASSEFEVLFNGTPIIVASDPDIMPGDYGVFSWAQRGQDWGTQVKDVTLTSSTVNQTHTFTDTGDVSWQEYTMSDSYGVALTVTHPSNFRLDFRDGTIRQDADNYTWATDLAPNVDFVSPAVVVDLADMTDLAAEDLTDYTMQVRMMNEDNDGIGLLVRVQGEDSFYRINFANQTMGTDGARAPQGMSIQKCQDGVWSELYRDDQANPLFVYQGKVVGTSINDVVQEAVPFDVSVTVNGNAISVQVIDDPDGTPMVINYPTVYDTTSPLTHGTVGFTAWGSGNAERESVYSGYGGDLNAPLVVAVPEPSMIVLLLLGVGMLFLRRLKR